MRPDPDGHDGHAHVEYRVDETDARCVLEMEPVFDCVEPIEIA